MGLPGVEPGTSRLSGVRSNHLSYRPTRTLISPVGIALEPPTFARAREPMKIPPEAHGLFTASLLVGPLTGYWPCLIQHPLKERVVNIRLTLYGVKMFFRFI